VITITTADIHDFTHGACFLLAKAVRDAAGWPPAAMWDGFGPAGHMFNVMPDGRLLDIEGAHTRNEMFGNWGRNGRRRGITTRFVHLDEWEFPASWGDPDPAPYVRRAELLVPVLLESIS
jgi:hypothetical protein